METNFNFCAPYRVYCGRMHSAIFCDNFIHDNNKPIKIKANSSTWAEQKTYEQGTSMGKEIRTYSYQEVESEVFYWSFETAFYVRDQLRRYFSDYTIIRYNAGIVLIMRFSIRFFACFTKYGAKEFLEQLSKFLEEYQVSGHCYTPEDYNIQRIGQQIFLILGNNLTSNK